MGDGVGISVCIPAFDEEGNIAETVAEAADTLARIGGVHEIVVCDDGSRDRTWAILEELRGRYPELVTLRHERNRGIAAAQETMVTAARGRIIFHIGADREWRMDEMIPMKAAIDAGADIVIGVRRKKQYTVSRKIYSAAYNGLVALLWGRHFGDLGSLKMARADLWKSLPFRSGSAFVHAERILLAHQQGARIDTVPVDHFARRAGQSKFASPKQAARAFVELVRFRLGR